MTDPPPISSTTLSEKKKINKYINKKNDTWHVTRDTWHVTRDTWHVTRDMWHVTRLGGWTFSQNFSSLALTVSDLWYYEDILGKGSVTQLMTRLFVGQPRLHRVCQLHKEVDLKNYESSTNFTSFLTDGTDQSERKCSQLSGARPVLDFYTLMSAPPTLDLGLLVQATVYSQNSPGYTGSVDKKGWSFGCLCSEFYCGYSAMYAELKYFFHFGNWWTLTPSSCQITFVHI